MITQEPQPDGLDLLTSEEVIQRLLADSVLRRFALTCVLPAVRFGTEWRFRKTDLDAWVERIGTVHSVVEP